MIQESNHQRRSGEQGFTIIEVTFAAIIMLIVSLGAASLFVYAITYNSGASDRALAAAVAQHELEKIRQATFTEVSALGVGTDLKPLGFAAGATSPYIVQSAGRNYRVQLNIGNADDAVTCPGCSPTLRGITLTVTPRGAGPVWARTPVTILTMRSHITNGAN